LCARVLADELVTALVDLRARVPVGKLHDRTSSLSGVLSETGATIFSGAL
jgi:hypothetical protein